MKDTAKALAFERTQQKPQSPWARRLFKQADMLKAA